MRIFFFSFVVVIVWWHTEEEESLLAEATTPLLLSVYDIRSIFKQYKAGLNSEFSFSRTDCLTETKEYRPPYYLLIGRERMDEFMPFPTVLVWSEMQTASSRIWTQVTDPISYDDNHYAK